MSGKRISIAHVRARTNAPKVWDLPEFGTMLPDGVVLTFVEAVEAARTYRNRTGGVYAKPLDDVLARFDFGGEAS